MTYTKKEKGCTFCSQAREKALYYALIAEQRLMACIRKLKDGK